MSGPAIVVGEASALALRRYWAACVEVARAGTMTPRQREEVRSYAVEVLTALHVENPGALGDGEYIAAVEQMRAQRRGRL